MMYSSIPDGKKNMLTMALNSITADYNKKASAVAKKDSEKARNTRDIAEGRILGFVQSMAIMDIIVNVEYAEENGVKTVKGWTFG